MIKMALLGAFFIFITNRHIELFMHFYMLGLIYIPNTEADKIDRKLLCEYHSISLPHATDLLRLGVTK